MNLGYLYLSALRDFLRAKRTLTWLAVAGGLVVMGLAIKRVSVDRSGDDLYALLSGTLVFRLLPLVSAIFSTQVLSAEVEQKTIVYLLTRPIPRSQLILMRSLASMTAVALVTIMAAVAVSASVFGAGALGNELFWRDIKAILIGSAAYGALFVMISLLVNRAMIVCILIAFVWETAVASLPGSMYYLSINSYLTAIAERPSVVETGPGLQLLSGGLSENLISTSFAWPAMFLATLSLTVAAMTWFTRFEYLPREDAE